MDSRTIIQGLIDYLGLVILLTFHEFGHAWMAWRCGDDTARHHGRVSLNPLAHIDPIGTVLIPMVGIFMPVFGRFLIGWARPVPVNPYNLRRPRVDDILVTLAGPWMNLSLAVVLLGVARFGLMIHSESLTELCVRMAGMSMLLCFFNLIPIPPLDGSQVVRSLFNISYETYYRVARHSWLVLILLLQIAPLWSALGLLTDKSCDIIGSWFGMA